MAKSTRADQKTKTAANFPTNLITDIFGEEQALGTVHIDNLIQEVNQLKEPEITIVASLYANRFSVKDTAKTIKVKEEKVIKQRDALLNKLFDRRQNFKTVPMQELIDCQKENERLRERIDKMRR